LKGWQQLQLKLMGKWHCLYSIISTP